VPAATSSAASAAEDVMKVPPTAKGLPPPSSASTLKQLKLPGLGPARFCSLSHIL